MKDLVVPGIISGRGVVQMECDRKRCGSIAFDVESASPFRGAALCFSVL